MNQDLKTNPDYDVCVIGAGVFGAWTAYELARRGRRVRLIDAYGAGNSRSSSGDESRIIRMGYGADEVYTRSAQRSLTRWKEFADQHSEQLFHQTGVLWLAHEDDPYAVRTSETLARAGVNFERLSIGEIARRFPQIGLENISWGMLEPESGTLSARRAVQAVVRAAIDLGVQFSRDAAISSLGARVGATCFEITTTSGQSISAGAFVFACGPWLPQMFPDLLGNRIQPTRQEVFYFGSPVGDDRFSQTCLPTLIDFKNEAYVLPDIEGRGVKVAVDRHGPPFNPDSDDRIASDEGLREVRRYLARRLPALKDAPVIETRICQYENTSNGDFLIDHHPDFENVWLVGGGSGHGFKHGPAVGEYVAARISGGVEGIEPRFSLKSKATSHERAVY